MKHIIVLLDGTLDTGMKLDARYASSNVFRTIDFLDDYNTSKRDQPQIILYFSGVGADYAWQNERSLFQRALSYIQAITSSGIEQQIAEAYISLSINHDPGDKIYIIGFSRGAVAAKILCDLIGLFGIVKSGNIHHFSEIWTEFCPVSPKTPLNHEKIEKLSGDFCYRSGVEFLGIFDAVMGTASQNHRRIKRHIFEPIHEAVRNSLHLLSMDEERRLFSAVQFSASRAGSTTNIWLPGSHSDVGGTYRVSTVKDWALYTMLMHLQCSGARLRGDGVKKLFLDALEKIKNPPFQLNKENSIIWSIIPPLRRTPRNINGEYDSYLHPIAYYFFETRIFISNKTKPYNIAYLGVFGRLKVYAPHDGEWKKYKGTFPAFVSPDIVRARCEGIASGPHVPTPAECATMTR